MKRSNTRKIIIHCSDTKEGKYFDEEDINMWHKKRGFKEIGYHIVILLNGEIRKGRDIEEIGAHCLGENLDSIGICYIGGQNENGKHEDTRTEEQKKSLESVINSLKRKYKEKEGIDLIVYGHKDFSTYKVCPCFNAYKEYNNE